MKWEHLLLGYGITILGYCVYRWPFRTIFGGGFVAAIMVHWIWG